jgi:hypothetical protein
MCDLKERLGGTLASLGLKNAWYFDYETQLILGATTLSITTYGITTLSIMTLSIMTFSMTVNKMRHSS